MQRQNDENVTRVFTDRNISHVWSGDHSHSFIHHPVQQQRSSPTLLQKGKVGASLYIFSRFIRSYQRKSKSTLFLLHPPFLLNPLHCYFFFFKVLLNILVFCNIKISPLFMSSSHFSFSWFGLWLEFPSFYFHFDLSTFFLGINSGIFFLNEKNYIFVSIKSV